MSTPRPDFLRPVGGPPPAAWLACALAAGACAAALWDAAAAWQLREAAFARRAEALARPSAPPRVPPADGAESRARRAALARLAEPWAGHFSALDALALPAAAGDRAPAGAVAWLALDLGEGRLRLEGQAPAAADALASAEALRAGGHFVDVVVGRLDAGGRFELNAKVRP